jgi:hypothetical protein
MAYSFRHRIKSAASRKPRKHGVRVLGNDLRSSAAAMLVNNAKGQVERRNPDLSLGNTTQCAMGDRGYRARADAADFAVNLPHVVDDQ